MSTIRLNWITILKAFLSIGIFAYHIGTVTVLFQPYLAPGPEIAEGFFFLSGYLAARTLLKQKLTVSSLCRFYFKRILRIVPSYFLVLFISFIALKQYLAPSGWSYLTHMALFTGNSWPTVTFFGNPAWYMNTNAPLWFVSVLFQFYLVSPLIYVCIKLGRKTPWRTFASTIAVGLFVRYILLTHAIPWVYAYDFQIFRLSLFGNLIFFVPGMALAFVKPAVKRQNSTFVLAIFLLFVWWFAATYVEKYATNNPTVIVFGMPLLLLLSFSVYTHGAMYLGSVVAGKFSAFLRGIEYFGKISYQFYLWHWVVILYLVKNFAASQTITDGIWVCIVAFTATTILSSLTFKVFDKT